MDTLRSPEAERKEQGGEGVVPYAVGCEVDGVRKESPGPSGEESGAFADGLLERQVDGDAGESGAEAIEGENDEGGFGGVEAEEVKDQRQQIRIKWRHQRRGAGDGQKRRSKAVAEEDAAGSPAHLPAELVVVEGGCGDVSEDKEDQDETEYQRHGNHKEEDGGGGTLLREEPGDARRDTFTDRISERFSDSCTSHEDLRCVLRLNRLSSMNSKGGGVLSLYIETQ